MSLPTGFAPQTDRSTKVFHGGPHREHDRALTLPELDPRRACSLVATPEVADSAPDGLQEVMGNYVREFALSDTVS